MLTALHIDYDFLVILIIICLRIVIIIVILFICFSFILIICYVCHVQPRPRDFIKSKMHTHSCGGLLGASQFYRTYMSNGFIILMLQASWMFIIAYYQAGVNIALNLRPHWFVCHCLSTSLINVFCHLLVVNDSCCYVVVVEV